LQALDRKDLGYYDRLTEEEKKKMEQAFVIDGLKRKVDKVGAAGGWSRWRLVGWFCWNLYRI
jgi:hypothetical protein